MNTVEAVNREVLTRNAGGDEELVSELIEIFQSELQGVKATLERAMVGRDARAIAAAAHRLKGSLLTVGATCAALAEEIELMAHKGDLFLLERLHEQLRAELAGVSASLSGIAKRRNYECSHCG